MEPLDDVFEGLPDNDRSMRFVNKSIGIGEEIIAAMNRKGMTQRDLANALHCNETLVSRWLAGMHNFTLRTLSAIEEILETDLVLTAEQVVEKIANCKPIVVKIPRERLTISDVTSFLQESWQTAGGPSEPSMVRRRTVNSRPIERNAYSNA
ncbi:MAG: helix-turn-helix domain-containing protein [Janthinobacterium lividum]